MKELPSVALTQRFLTLCEDYGSQGLAVRMIASDRSAGVSGLPAADDWTEWDADQMRAAVDYLQHKRGGRSDPIWGPPFQGRHFAAIHLREPAGRGDIP